MNLENNTSSAQRRNKKIKEATTIFSNLFLLIALVSFDNLFKFFKSIAVRGEKKPGKKLKASENIQANDL